MRFNCKRDIVAASYDLDPGADTVEDLFVLIASDFQLPIDVIAVRCGTHPSWNSDRLEQRLSQMVDAFTPPTGPTPLALDLHVMTRDMARTLDNAAARIESLFSSPPVVPAPSARLEDEEIQRRLYEEIQRRNIDENLKSAYEYTPEAFVPVTMLYVPCTINGVKIKAFVDSGAQMSIMNVKTAERCGLLRLVDKRMKGVAVGVGKQTIIGRIHLVTVKLDSLHIPFSFSVLEEQQMDVIIGLDQLKRHRFVLDLRENCLCYEDKKISFLPESEIPDFAKLMGVSSLKAPSQGREESDVPERHRSMKPSPPPKKSASPAAGVKRAHRAGSSTPPLPAVKAPRDRTPPVAPRSPGGTSPNPRHETPSSKHRRLVQELMSATGIQSEGEAMGLLSVSDWDVGTAASLYFAQHEDLL